MHPTLLADATSTSLSSLTSPGALVVFMYSYAQSIIGLCVFVMFLYAGLQLIVTGDTNKAKQIAIDATIGLVLLFSAYIILNSINHDLVDQQEAVK